MWYAWRAGSNLYSSDPVSFGNFNFFSRILLTSHTFLNSFAIKLLFSNLFFEANITSITKLKEQKNYIILSQKHKCKSLKQNSMKSQWYIKYIIIAMELKWLQKYKVGLVFKYQSTPFTISVKGRKHIMIMSINAKKPIWSNSRSIYYRTY